MKTHSPTSLTLILILSLVLCASALQAQTVTVKLLNLSEAPLGPLLVATHPSGLSPLFNPSKAPSAALRMFSLGAPALLEAEARDLADGHPLVRFGSTAGPGPGETATVEIAAPSNHSRSLVRISLAVPLAPLGFAGLHGLSVGPESRHDVLAWEADGTLLAHRSLPSPIARAWIRYNFNRRVRRQGQPSVTQPQLTAAQQADRDACLQGSPTCIWRPQGAGGFCSDCLPPLRPNAARTYCVE